MVVYYTHPRLIMVNKIANDIVTNVVWLLLRFFFKCSLVCSTLLYLMFCNF
jgi:hypothetical protein